MTHLGTLYIVGTPIGNLEDMTFRAIRILQSVGAIAAEDTRHTGKLLQHFQITTPQISYHEHNQQQRIPELLQRLRMGEDIAVVTDAGMPAIADPGYELIKASIAENIPIVPIPGANAAITAVCAAGLPTDRFIFEGFLPAKGKPRQERLAVLATETRTMILYESPHRLKQTLSDLAEGLGSDRAIVLGRELTKMHEEFWRGTVAEAIAHYSKVEPQGEFTLTIAGMSVAPLVLSEEALKTELEELLKQGLSRSQASRQLAQLTHLPKRQLYQLALSLPDPD
ncbi:16S rRNA (cytidine(1402)-2'-O)-methyltransferase [Desertifilum sp. FACHB-1129]|uniref:Ribosomal RNA small subunit methyltransferase I n=2 Tax=Desertifilum tharense IPPAS B-1220 TaxID=1781255 RepID=A0A1E5QJM3_9CYAN|nr:MULTISPECIES: 16S rRNA (cytidine(1402)-2'-O)-methyltransferase [Desertifilum]MDA0210936.1 16S rRNA (cytidine(1402)-2'-O)-methyltransferase [Cyanobacteria bacterium FC1]MBD2313461.1 16S rRNA (cytidine(1402)-2'-O)-methyltransferase [Desertifilum sp. FACHB-1129]MBD2322331.1 16S rRNA (cytidine(1402)-2'-O)-methyltransferase [Desertifilum sp. FACHB-866]MBD2332493.1 16S rRNA (cytidine(1402)-2'-O)-methyltransferase [Desertifilum sp. FACHB-868]OEJ74896.1 16S rRNA (cytidine(1402)-2'-O)-methyltransfer